MGETAGFLGLLRDTLKFYEAKGLVSTKKDNKNGYRKYNMINIKTLQSLNRNEELSKRDNNKYDIAMLYLDIYLKE
ncbi:MerR family DNA-binding transcriptional regulator [uncultured Clostridium sp.]|uniref:MerR family DNA-binding transcriptional regulator n=1 Tax=uncultured Clostridium sp. TaxID=59620 RepID=UPI00260D0D0C|nr:MerR family DNA-binding transcriptional regulator [uncultured Clostridium sp.]